MSRMSRPFGIITGFRNNELSDVEVHTLVAQRERARMNNDYELSDMIRNALCLELRAMN